MSEFSNKERQKQWKQIELQVNDAKEDYYRRYRQIDKQIDVPISINN